MKRCLPAEKYDLKIIFIIALLIRLIVALVGYSNQVWHGFADDAAYSSMADSVLDQGPFLLDNDSLHPTAKIVGPGMAWIIAILRLSLGSSWLPVFILNSILGALMCVIIYKIAYRVGSRATALMAAFWASIYVFYLRHIPTSGKEIWIQFLFILAFYSLLILLENQRRVKSLIVCALALALLVHIDERYFAYVLLYSILMLVFSKYRLMTKFKQVLAFVSLVLICMLPWMIRNYYVYEKIVIGSVRTAPIVDKILGQNEENGSTFKPSRNAWMLNKSQIDSILAGKMVLIRGKDIGDDHARAIRRGLYPKRFTLIQEWLSALRELWEPIDIWDNYKQFGFRWDGKWSSSHNVISLLSYGLLLPFAIIGIFNQIACKGNFQIISVIILVFHSLIHVLFIPYTLYRYRIPIDFVVIILAFVTVDNVISTLWQRAQKTKEI